MSSQRRCFLAAAAGLAVPVLIAAESPKVDPESFISMAHGTNAVDCGGHFAQNCALCPGTNGELWCNGECMWYAGHCELPTLWARLMAFTHYSFWLWWHCLPVTFLAALSTTAYAMVYKKKVVDDIPEDRISGDEDDEKEREVGLFDCFKQGEQCMWAVFCSPVVSGKNFATGGVTGYWLGCCLVFVGVYSFFWPFWCIMAVVRTSLSVSLQKRLGFRPNVVVSCCTTLFCFPCEVGRESIEVDQALGVEIKCPFKVEKSWGAAAADIREDAGDFFDRTCGTRVCS